MLYDYLGDELKYYFRVNYTRIKLNISVFLS